VGPAVIPRALRPAARGLALLAAAALAAPADCAGAAAPLRLTIAFTGDVSGYLEPCG
jgi:hypothetical protein